MGIDNIHILTDPDGDKEHQDLYPMVYVQVLIAAHQRGDHTRENPIPGCPLCY